MLHVSVLFGGNGEREGGTKNLLNLSDKGLAGDVGTSSPKPVKRKEILYEDEIASR